MDEPEPPSPPRSSSRSHSPSASPLLSPHGHPPARHRDRNQNQNQTQLQNQNQFLLGLVLLLIVVALWVGSSFLMSSMFRDESWNQPWLVTYICTSSFTLYLVRPAIVYLRRPKFIKTPLSPPEAVMHKTPRDSVRPSRSSYSPLLPDDQGDDRGADPEVRPRAVRAFAVPEAPLTTREVAWLASTFVFLWFAANWTVNAALGYTSVSSTTILSSMSGFFTLAAGVALGVETFSLGRLAAVGASVSGVVLVSMADRESAHTGGEGQKWFLGDVLALSSAALYALYVLLMKVKVKDESRVDMQLFFGFVGAINLLCFWPIGVLLHYTGVEPFALPRSRKLWLSVLVNALCTFVSDYVYMLAMLKTSPLVVTLGISLTLPVAVVGDMFKGVQMPASSVIGAGLVLSSFGILTWVEQGEARG